MSTGDAKVIGWTTEKALLGMKAPIAKRWEAVKSPKCVLYYAFPYRRSDEGRGLGRSSTVSYRTQTYCSLLPPTASLPCRIPKVVL